MTFFASRSAARVMAPSSVPASSRLGAGTVVLTGLAYFWLGLAFSYLDRRHRLFGLEAALWAVWTLLGFGAGALHALRSDASAGQRQVWVMGIVGFLLALFPGSALYAFPRWICVALLILMGARAATMRTERDMYLTLTVVFAVSFMVGTHATADWSLWFYLGPAWLCCALALAWQHAHCVALPRSAKWSLTTAFVSAAAACALLLFVVVPKPSLLGFGFLPGGEESGPWGPAFKQGGTHPGRAPAHGDQGGGGGAGASGQGSGSTPTPEWLEQDWRGMLGALQSAASDPFMPQWQRDAIAGMASLGQSLLDVLTGRGAGASGGAARGASGGEGDGNTSSSSAPSPGAAPPWWWVLIALLFYLAFRYRHRMGLAAALGAAWVLAHPFPKHSMRLSALAMTWCLHSQGLHRLQGRSVREHWSGVIGLPEMAARWLHRALDLYGAMRFGAVPATPQRALQMRQAVQGAADVVLLVLPKRRRGASNPRNS